MLRSLLAPVPDAYSVEEVRSEAALEALAPAWTQLLQRSSSDVPFLAPEWLLSWWRTFGAACGSELLVLALRRGARLCAVAPLVIETERPAGVPIRVLRFLGHTMSDCLDIVLCGEPVASLSRLVEHLVQRGGWDVLDLREFHGSSLSLRPLVASLREAGCGVRVDSDSGCHFAQIDGSWDAFYRSRFDRHSRKDHRREWRLLETAGEIRAEVRWSPCLDTDLVEKLAAVERSHPRAGAARPGNFNTEPARSFLLDVLPRLEQRGWLMVSTLSCGGEILAYYLGLRYGGSHYVYATAYRREFRRGAAGKLLLLHTLQRLWESGGERIELLRGDQPFKRQWTTAVRQNARIMASRRSLGAQARGWLWFVALPALQRTAPRLHAALDVAGRRGWRAAAVRGVNRLLRARAAHAEGSAA